MLTKAPRGTKDILPKSVGKWQYMEEKIRAICALYGYEEIRTPVFEHTELFSRAIGENTDVVDKEMYTFTDRGGRSVTLRPENTASAMRAYIENKLFADTPLTKLFYIGSMFRYDRPQAGRLREFHQFGVEAVGEKSAALDAETILLAANFLKSVGLKDLTVNINSVGCPKCRAEYRQKLQEFFKDKLQFLCEDCKNRFERAPMRILDCKKDSGQEFMKDAPKITDCLCDECREHFAETKKYLTAANLSYGVDSRLVRGLDYYTKTAFEIKYEPLGAQSAVAGGGRYDGLIKELGGDDTPAVGFAVGLERVLLAMEKQGVEIPEKNGADIFIVNLEEPEAAFNLMQQLRARGQRTLMDYGGKSLKSQMKRADKLGVKLAVILGADEVKNGVVTVKNMADGSQRQVAMGEFTEEFSE